MRSEHVLFQKSRVWASHLKLLSFSSEPQVVGLHTVPSTSPRPSGAGEIKRGLGYCLSQLTDQIWAQNTAMTLVRVPVRSMSLPLTRDGACQMHTWAPALTRLSTV